MPRLDHLGGVRVRTTLAATLIVALVFAVGGLALVRLQRSLLVSNLDDTLITRAEDIALLVEAGSDLESLGTPSREEALAQVVGPDGSVVASSENVTGQPPVTGREAAGITTVDSLPIEDDPFRLLVETAAGSDGPYRIIIAGGLDPIEESLDALSRSLLLIAPILLVVVAGVTWLIVGRALRPVESIRAEVAAISGQRLDRRVPEPSSGDEIGRLARTMNLMLDRLQAAWARQDRFVADASHELRSPLTSIRSQLEVDLAHPTSADWQDTHAEVLEEVDNLQQLVDDLLFLARTDAGVRSRSEPVDLDDIVLREAERIRLQTDLDVVTRAVSAGQVAGDRYQLQRLVRNLRENAAHHGETKVEIGLREAEDGAELTVSDDGPGIPVEAREAIFERFVTLDDARTRGGVGTGLGLAIVHEIVAQHGGAISVVGDPGHGTVFTVRFPPCITTNSVRTT